jgi:hypothetical protein
MANHVHTVFMPLPDTEAGKAAWLTHRVVEDRDRNLGYLTEDRQFVPLTFHSLAAIMRSIKRHTAREANLLLGRNGAFWQDESYDHYSRNPVAVLINKAMIEIPPKFAGRPPVNPEARKDVVALLIMIHTALLLIFGRLWRTTLAERSPTSYLPSQIGRQRGNSLGRSVMFLRRINSLAYEPTLSSHQPKANS